MRYVDLMRRFLAVEHEYRKPRHKWSPEARFIYVEAMRQSRTAPADVNKLGDPSFSRVELPSAHRTKKHVRKRKGKRQQDQPAISITFKGDGQRSTIDQQRALKALGVPYERSQKWSKHRAHRELKKRQAKSVLSHHP